MSIKALRLQAKLTQAELAQKVDVTQAAICRWERGEIVPLPKYQKKMAWLFGVTVDELLADGKEHISS